MSVVTPTDVRAFLTDHIRQQRHVAGRGPVEDLPEDCDLMLSGVIDSLGLLELVTALSEHFGQEISFETLDPEHMTVVGPLCSFVAEQLSQD